jgi:excisionase family DNA binding protein
MASKNAVDLQGDKPPAPIRQDDRILAAKWDGRSTLTVEEAGEILGISRWSAYEAANKGELPVIRVGRRWIVPRHALEKLLTP